MTQSWSQTRTITQIVSSTVEAPDAHSGSKEGVIKNRTVIPGTTAPGWFVNDLKHPQSKDPALAEDLKNIEWGPIYAIPWLKNKIEFFVTGSQYFKDVAREMKAAKQCIFIAGWQVNFDVEMGEGETLFEVLRGAVERGVHVFVMPWLAPAPMAFQTGIFETLLALNQLNAGLSERRAWTLPAAGQSDIAGGLGLLGFSHHQKMVVIDHTIGYMGGMDLAYGRRDDGSFDLQAQGRSGNEFYSPCTPKIETVSHQQAPDYVPLAQLLAASSSAPLAEGYAWWTTPLDLEAVNYGLDWVDERRRDFDQVAWRIANWFDSTEWFPAGVRAAAQRAGDAVHAVQDAPREAALWLARRTWERMRGSVQQELLSYGADKAAAIVWMIDWLRGGHLDELPPGVYECAGTLLEAFGLACATVLAEMTMARAAPLPDLLAKRKAMPYGGKIHDSAKQPRMPWHDVHMRVEGPAVFELVRNFTQRWDGMVMHYRGSGIGALMSNAAGVPGITLVGALLKTLGLSGGSPFNALSAYRLPLLAQRYAVQQRREPVGTHKAQLLRSASVRLCRSEYRAITPADNVAHRDQPMHEQNNCLKAMLQAISSAQHFIYIEGQFFQSAFGKDSRGEKWSGPMAALRDPWQAKNAKEYMATLGIPPEMPLREIPRHLDLAKLDRVVREANRDDDFMTDFKTNLSSLAVVELFRLLGKAQPDIVNPIGHALGARIRQAILDGLHMHVYIVLPVHPEGTLDDIAVMSQVHLTMQSLVFGHNSLINTIRRAILEGREWRAKRDMTDDDRHALYERLAATKPADLAKGVKDEWQHYLTLLNLRNWTVLNGQPVTEQVYVHSKLLIADDRVAILGSANINDRSLLGTRDSELAMVIHDDVPTYVKLDGQHQQAVSTCVHKLRVSLWRKLFGLDSKSAASELEAVLNEPANPATWTAIQKRAEDNAKKYRNAFAYVPCSLRDQVDGEANLSIWPTWDNKTRKMRARLPFLETFWRPPSIKDKQRSWEGQVNPAAQVPKDIAGFICALPLQWTEGENNFSGLNLTLLANVDGPFAPGAPPIAGEAQAMAAAPTGNTDTEQT
jgi:phospholipase D1/2